MKKFISTGLAALLLTSAITACAPMPETKVSSASAEGIAKYTAYLEEKLTEMPDSLVLATAENADTYGVDMSDFADDGYFTRAENGEVVILGKTDAGLDRAVRDYVKYGNEDDYFKVYNEGYRVKRLTIAGNDISEYAIVRDDDADDSQTAASSQLRKYIALTCGAELSEYTASEYAKAADKPTRTIRLTVDYPALGDEAFTIEIGEDANVTISGGRYRGCIYGIFDLLENVGWRFVNDADDGDLIDYLYESEHVDLTAALNRTESSPFSYRRAYGGYGGKLRSEKYKDHYSPAYGAYGLTSVACHGLQNWHSSIFYGGYYNGLFEDGKQPCFTDEEILRYIEEFVLRRVESALAAGQTLGKEFVYIDLSQWDGGGGTFCHCASCQEIITAERTIMGPMLYMANQNAALLKEKGYDGVWISLLAYHGTDIAPIKTAPLDNVRISYCFYPWPCMNHSLSGEDCPYETNLGYHKQFIKWEKLCTNDNLDVWYYPLLWADSHISGAPILDGIYDSFRYLADHGTDGIMAHSATTQGSALHSLITYLCARLLWDPYMSREEFDAYVSEWFMIVYGDAGEPLYEYYMMIEKSGDTVGCFNTLHGGAFGSYQDHIAKTAHDGAYIAEHFDYFLKLFDEAHALADTEHMEKLVRRYKAGMLYLCIGMTHEDRYVNGTDAEKEKITALYEELYGYLKEFRFDTPSNGVLSVPESLDASISPFNWLFPDS